MAQRAAGGGSAAVLGRGCSGQSSVRAEVLSTRRTQRHAQAGSHHSCQGPGQLWVMLLGSHHVGSPHVPGASDNGDTESSCMSMAGQRCLLKVLLNALV